MLAASHPTYLFIVATQEEAEVDAYTYYIYAAYLYRHCDSLISMLVCRER